MLPYEEWPQEYKDTRDSLWALEKEFRDKKAAALSELVGVEKGYECVVCGAKADRDVDRPTYITFNLNSYWIKNPNLHERYKK